MDLLYSRYSDPFGFMKPYIEQGRFGELVFNIVKQEQERRKEKAEKDEEEKLWMAYVHSYSDKSFIDWKAEVLKPDHASNGTGKKDEDMTQSDIDKILLDLFPDQLNQVTVPQA